MVSLTEDKRVLGYELLRSYPNISHFATTRYGGCGTGAYASFNCSPYCGDDEEVVRLNQQRLFAELPQVPDALIIPQQTHETDICVVDSAFLSLSVEEQQRQLYGIDAVITNQPGCCICISTADCVPLLLYDKKHGVVAAVHSGWRGTVARIVAKTLQKMNEQYQTRGEDLLVVIGPSISQVSFEVGEEVLDAFGEAHFEIDKIASRNAQTGKPHIDLWEANRLQLLAFGVPEAQVEVAGICTYIRHDLFFSARRLGIRSGRMLSGIMINS